MSYEDHNAVEKTNSLLRLNAPIDALIPNEFNPNEMDEASFNMLYDNLGRVGITDPILVRPHPTMKGKYKIIGGHHRWEVAKLHDMEEVPVTVITDPDFDEDAEKFQLVRHNIIHGKMSAKKFADLHASLSGKYSEEVAAEMFGFTSEEEFKKMVKATGKSLPKEMQKSFQDAAKEIKTVNDLSLVLNRLFTSYGDTVPFGYMLFDFGGQDHVWVRMKAKQKQQLINLGNMCREQHRSIDSAMEVLLQLIAQGTLNQADFMEGLLAMPAVNMEGLMPHELPTEDLIAQGDSMLDALK